MENILKNTYGISEKTVGLLRQAEGELTEVFRRFEKNAEINQAKVLSAFHEEGISERHLLGTTGYGYDDAGREALERIYAKVFGAEAALVRQQFVSGTHALAACFFGVLRPGDTLLFAAGSPYVTLEEVVGIRGGGDMGSLADWGV
ncbi:MAG: methionine gamma-lyase family protein, partial [Clostridia bacterium]|nr:methionine gamma-lyase family protein [Clostridia bacterium]